jgi:cytochrome c-type biogenesis protein CcmH/NrfF
MRAWAAPLLVVFAAAAGGFAFAHLYLPPAPVSPQLAVEQRLMCPQCEEVRLDVCDRPICTDMKADIARRLAAGEAQDSIVSSYRLAYGASILSSDQPADAAALLPWAAVALGVASLAGLAVWRLGR